MLIAAKAKCQHGQWQWMFSDVNPDKLPFGDRTAQRLIEVSRHPTLSNPTHASDLPASWMTLYDLSKLPEDKLEAAFAEGRIHPDMERKDVKRLMYGHGELQPRARGRGVGVDNLSTPRVVAATRARGRGRGRRFQCRAMRLRADR